MALSDLLPASFRGVPFAVVRSGGTFGRRIVNHQYPGRDQSWSEDLGRGARRYRMTGFLLEGDLILGGGPIDLQRALAVAAAEAKGAGLLTHPTLGVLNVSCESLSVSDGIEADNYAEVEWSFIEAGKQAFPSIASSTVDAVEGAVSGAALTIAAVASTALAIGVRASTTGQAELSAAAAAWSDQVETAGDDATAALGLAAGLSGSFGRYSAGATVGFASGTTYVNSSTVADLISAGAGQRQAIAAAAASLSGEVALLNIGATTGDVAAAASGLVDSLSVSCADPADAVRLLSGLQAAPPATDTVSGAALGDLVRRALALALARASSAYQPSSYDDAVAILGRVLAVLDAEIEVAGDQGDDTVFEALRDLRQKVVADLTARGGALARIRAFALDGSLPDSVVAQRLYRDPSRADQLTGQVNPVHPLFLPASFRALAA